MASPALLYAGGGTSTIRNKNVAKFVINIVAGLIAYAFRKKKPALNISLLTA